MKGRRMTELKNKTERFSTVTIRGNNEQKRVKIGSKLKPQLQNQVITKWQTLIDTIAHLVHVPAGLIMRLNEETIEVFVKSNTEGNPYEAGQKTPLIYGVYCETVIGTQQRLLVSNAKKDPIWAKDNPAVAANMISYLGFPINWPDGEVFGTVCLFDNKENHYSQAYETLLEQLKQHIESDLKLLVLNEELSKKNEELRRLNQTKSKFLSIISHDVRGNLSIITQFFHLILTDFEEYDSVQLKEILESLSNNASASYEILQDLLSWAKYDLVNLHVELETVDIIEVLEKTLFTFEQGVRMKEIVVSKNYCSPTLFLQTDKKMITVVVRNIISNAIKYNHKGGQLFIQVAEADGKHQIKIQDSGIGMSKMTLEKLFSYNKEYSSGTAGESSAGVGLILIKEFVDKLGIAISIESELKKGTTVTLDL